MNSRVSYNVVFVLNFKHLNFEFVSDFGFRILSSSAWCPILVTPLLGWKWGLAGNRVWKRASQQAQFGLLSESKPAERDKK